MKTLLLSAAILFTSFAHAAGDLADINTSPQASANQPCRNITQQTQNVYPLLKACTAALKATSKTRGSIRAANYCSQTCGSTGSNKVIKVYNKVVKSRQASGELCEIVTKMKYHCK